MKLRNLVILLTSVVIANSSLNAMISEKSFTAFMGAVDAFEKANMNLAHEIQSGFDELAKTKVALFDRLNKSLDERDIAAKKLKTAAAAEGLPSMFVNKADTLVQNIGKAHEQLLASYLNLIKK